MFPEAELDENIFAVKRFPPTVTLPKMLAELRTWRFETTREFRPVIFPRTRRFEARVVVPVVDRTLVAIRFPPTTTLEETFAEPITWRFVLGEVVPIPTDPRPTRFWEL